MDSVVFCVVQTFPDLGPLLIWTVILLLGRPFRFFFFFFFLLCQRHSITQMCGVIVKQIVFLTVNHRGPLPLREFHSTDETRVWRDPGGS